MEMSVCMAEPIEMVYSTLWINEGQKLRRHSRHQLLSLANLCQRSMFGMLNVSK